MGAITLFATINLADYPTPWFDEGLHLHVPQTLVRFGVYADRSSDGYRYFGPTVGVGPTVMLPIAGAFSLFGIGLLQARAVMVLFLLAAVTASYRFGRVLGGPSLGALTIALLLTSPSLVMFETGRQVLGEVPALLFLVMGMSVWLSGWSGSWRRLTLAGLLLGASAVTKQQNLIMIGPAILLALVLNLVYYRTAPTRVFLWPGILVGAVFGGWQAAFLLYLDPSSALANLAALREASAGAAAVFEPLAVKRALTYLLSFSTYGAVLAFALPYAVLCSAQRSRQAQQWGVVTIFVVCNLLWFAVASIGWPRYAFPGVALASVLVARLILDLVRQDPAHPSRPLMALRGAAMCWGAIVLLSGAVVTGAAILNPPDNAPAKMSAFLNQRVPLDAVIETWEPELGALTAHNYHYPPSRLLATAVAHIWRGGPSPRGQYDALETLQPPYVVVGPFATWVSLYSSKVLHRDYVELTSRGAYTLYQRKP